MRLDRGFDWLDRVLYRGGDKTYVAPHLTKCSWSEVTALPVQPKMWPLKPSAQMALVASGPCITGWHRQRGGSGIKICEGEGYHNRANIGGCIGYSWGLVRG